MDSLLIIIGKKLFPFRNDSPQSINLHALILISRSDKVSRQAGLQIKLIYYIHIGFIRFRFVRNQNSTTDWRFCPGSICAQRILVGAICAGATDNYCPILLYIHNHLENEVSWWKTCFAFCFWIEYIGIGSNLLQILSPIIIDIPLLLEGRVTHASPYINSWPVNWTLSTADCQSSNWFLCVYQ